MAEEQLVLVDENDRPSGEGGKLDVHRRGLRHRAFSIFVWNAAGEMLLQRRAAGKYHSAGLWTNSCCGHPRPGEQVRDAASRRLGEELGMAATLQPAGHYSYRADLPNALVENEYVHLFAAWAKEDPLPNPEEVDSVRWISPDALLADIAAAPEAYTAWFRLYVADIPETILSPPTSLLDSHASSTRVPL